MKISELINRLEQIKEVEGDLECINDWDMTEFESEMLNAESSSINEIKLYIG